MYRAFYCFYDEGVDLPSRDAVPIDQADIYSGLFGRLRTDGDFVGLIGAEGHTLQIMYHPEGDRYWVDLPRPELHGSYGAYMTFDEVADLLKALPSEFGPDALPSLTFEAW